MDPDPAFEVILDPTLKQSQVKNYEIFSGYNRDAERHAYCIQLFYAFLGKRKLYTSKLTAFQL